MDCRVNSSRLRKTKAPCEVCGLGLSHCICAEIPRLTLSTRVALIVHAKELKRTTNSGRLAVAALSNSKMLIRGRDHSRLDLSPLLTPDYTSLVFFPSEGAVELSLPYIASLTRPVQLLVPDGNWRQASKVPVRHKELSHLPRVMLKIRNAASHHLRAEHSEFGMSTLEAIAHAIGLFEGPVPGAALMALYEKKLQATLAGRGVYRE